MLGYLLFTDALSLHKVVISSNSHNIIEVKVWNVINNDHCILGHIVMIVTICMYNGKEKVRIYHNSFMQCNTDGLLYHCVPCLSFTDILVLYSGVSLADNQLCPF